MLQQVETKTKTKTIAGVKVVAAVMVIAGLASLGYAAGGGAQLNIGNQCNKDCSLESRICVKKLEETVKKGKNKQMVKRMMTYSKNKCKQEYYGCKAECDVVAAELAAEQAVVEEKYCNFKDADLEKAVIDELAKQGLNFNPGEIPESAAKNITELDSNDLVEYLASEDAYGIKELGCLTGLTHIDFSEDAVGYNIYFNDISPLANLKGLTHLNVSPTSLANISILANFKELTYLNLDLEYVDISLFVGLSKLEDLVLNNSKLIKNFWCPSEDPTCFNESKKLCAVYNQLLDNGVNVVHENPDFKLDIECQPELLVVSNDLDFGEKTVEVPATAVKVGSWLVKNNHGEKISILSLDIGFSSEKTDAVDASAEYSNLYIEYGHPGEDMFGYCSVKINNDDSDCVSGSTCIESEKNKFGTSGQCTIPYNIKPSVLYTENIWYGENNWSGENKSSGVENLLHCLPPGYYDYEDTETIFVNAYVDVSEYAANNTTGSDFSKTYLSVKAKKGCPMFGDIMGADWSGPLVDIDVSNIEGQTINYINNE